MLMDTAHNTMRTYFQRLKRTSANASAMEQSFNVCDKKKGARRQPCRTQHDGRDNEVRINRHFVFIFGILSLVLTIVHQDTSSCHLTKTPDLNTYNSS